MQVAFTRHRHERLLKANGQAIAFFGVDRVLLGSNTPMDDRPGGPFIPNALATIEQLGLGTEERDAILAGNAERRFDEWLPKRGLDVSTR